MFNKFYLKNKIFITIIFLLKLKFSFNRIIYMCSKRHFKNFQCLDEVVKGDNKVFNLKKCASNEICQIISTEKENNKLGICTRKYVRALDQQYCRVNADCSSYLCNSKICEGFPEGRKCILNRFQCKNGLVCRSIIEINQILISTNNNNNFIITENNTNPIFNNILAEDFLICAQPLKENETCKLTSDCEINFVCSRNSNFLKKKVCTKIASQEIGTIVDDEMACKTGDMKKINIENKNETICVEREEIVYDCGENVDLDENFCVVNITIGNNTEIFNETCEISSLGAFICNDRNKTTNFENYIEDFNKKIKKLEKKIKNKEFNIEKFRFNLDDVEIARKYFEYKYWNFVYDADDCAYDYYFNLNNANFLKNNKIFLYFIFFVLLVLV